MNTIQDVINRINWYKSQQKSGIYHNPYDVEAELDQLLLDARELSQISDDRVIELEDSIYAIVSDYFEW